MVFFAKKEGLHCDFVCIFMAIMKTNVVCSECCETPIAQSLEKVSWTVSQRARKPGVGEAVYREFLMPLEQ